MPSIQELAKVRSKVGHENDLKNYCYSFDYEFLVLTFNKLQIQLLKMQYDPDENENGKLFELVK